MADTDETAAGTVRRTARRAAAPPPPDEERLEEQIARLQEEIRGIGTTLARLTDERLKDARSTARSQYRSAVKSGQNVVEELSEQVNSYEGQLAEAIRERPLTAVAGAIGVGFLIAMLSRR